MLIPYSYSKPPKLLSEAELRAKADVAGLHPEFLRRLLAMIEASGYTVGIGGGSRTNAQQKKEFLRRHVEDPAGVILWEGKRWTLRPGMAPLAPPDDRSYHMPTIDGRGVAADLIGDLDRAHALASEFMLRDFRNVGTKPEPWHFQLAEIPTARANYNQHPEKYPLQTWGAPSLPDQEPLPVEDEDMAQREFVVVGNDDNHADPNRFLYDGMDLRHLTDENDAVDVLLIWGFNTKIHPEAAGADMSNARAKVDAILRAPYWKPLGWINQRLAERA